MTIGSPDHHPLVTRRVQLNVEKDGDLTTKSFSRCVREVRGEDGI